MLSLVKAHFQTKGWRVNTVTEGATLFFQMTDVSPGVLKVENESAYREMQWIIADFMGQLGEVSRRLPNILNDGKPWLILHDRGEFDAVPYVGGEAEFARRLAESGRSEAQLFAKYDLIFHLESLAAGKPAAYEQTSNDRRYETTEVAAQMDAHIGAAWRRHPRYTLIRATSDFSEKVESVIQKLSVFLSASGQ